MFNLQLVTMAEIWRSEFSVLVLAQLWTWCISYQQSTLLWNGGSATPRRRGGGSSMTPLIIQYLLPFFSHIVYTRAEELRRNDGRSQTTIAPRIFHPIYHTAKQETAAARRRAASRSAYCRRHRSLPLLSGLTAALAGWLAAYLLGACP